MLRSLFVSSCVRRVALAWTLGLVVVLIVGVVPASAATQLLGEHGSGAEQSEVLAGVAVDASGDVYLSDLEGSRVDKLDGSGSWLWAAGVGVLDEAPEWETCTASCSKGSQVGSPEALEHPTGVAVDTDPLSSSYGDLYVVDESHSRVLKLDSSGNFVLMFGGGVNENGADVCLAGEKCKLYAETGTGDGEFSYMQEGGFNSFIGVGPGGAVYVGDKARVEVFEPSGVWKENISLTGLSTEARPTALAVDGSGDVFVKDAGVAGVHEFVPPRAPATTVWSESGTTFDSSSTTVTALAFDSVSDHLFVGDANNGFHVLEYDSAGNELASFASKTVVGENKGLAFSEAADEVYASDSNPSFGSVSGSRVWAIPVPSAGPVVDRASATPEPRGAATLEAQVDPEGNETTVHFEYVDEAHFKESGYASAASTAAGSIPSGFEDQAVSAHPSLVPGTVYHFRVVASNSQGTATGEDQSFQEMPPALITGPWATNVAGTSVTLAARINPLGASTTYRLEYGTSISYDHVLSGSVGEGMGDVTVSRHIQGLEPVTTYHYRIVTSNEVGVWQSPDETFTTQAVADEMVLPDGRAWELVSPPNKHGALIEFEGFASQVQAAIDGSGIAYTATFPMTENSPSRPLDIANANDFTTVLSKRTASGWSSEEIGTHEELPETENESFQPNAQSIQPLLFSADLSQTLMEPGYGVRQTLSPEVKERTVYLRDNATGKYVPLVTPSNVPPGTKYGGEGQGTEKGSGQEMRFLSATPDFSHVVLESPFRLTPEAVEKAQKERCKANEVGCPENLYEWSNGRLALVDILPDGEALPEAGGSGAGGFDEGGALLGRESLDVVHAVSNDGRRVVWEAGSLTGNKHISMYVRDMVEGRTLQFGGPEARYETMSGDGSRVFYWEKSELYAFDFATDTTTDVTADHITGERFAGVTDGFIMATGEDGSYVYYVAKGVLASGAISGEDNLYVSHYDGSGWSAKLIATLSKTDEMPFEFFGTEPLVKWQYMDAEASPDGRYLAFMSSRPLTGYDNTDVSEAETEDNVDGRLVKTKMHHDEEVYLYDATANHLICASCNPTGARPSGLYEPTPSGNARPPVVDGELSWRNHWLAANLPGGHPNDSSLHGGLSTLLDQPRYVLNSGRLFFNSSDALVAHDTNGLNDVYEYEPADVGSCSSANGAFSARSVGCVSLLTAGTSGGESAFMEASQNGDDVFFVTSSKLVDEDVDTENDVYDARVCSAAAPCRSEPVVPPPCTSGDSCKAAPSPQPEIFGPAPSATFSGTGNVKETSPTGLRKRSLTRAQKLARALRTCRKDKGKRRRTLCERRARKRYGIERSGQASANGRGRR